MNDLCTLFTCPKPFSEHNAIIQRNALACWRTLSLRCIVFGEEDGVAEATSEFKFIHIPHVSKSDYGTPLLNDMFEKAQAIAETPLVCWINSDILLLPSFLEALELAVRRWKNFLMIGRRWDIDITESLSFEEGWPEKLEHIRRKRGKLHASYGMDYFAFPCGLLRHMPAFVVGRPGWDNWLIWTIAATGIPLLNATSGAPVLHQNHNYAHVPQGRNNSYYGPEADMNNQLIRKHSPDLDIIYTSIYRAEWRIYDSRIIFDDSRERWWWFFRFKIRRFFAKILTTLLGPERFATLKEKFKDKNLCPRQ